MQRRGALVVVPRDHLGRLLGVALVEHHLDGLAGLPRFHLVGLDDRPQRLLLPLASLLRLALLQCPLLLRQLGSHLLLLLAPHEAGLASLLGLQPRGELLLLAAALGSSPSLQAVGLLLELLAGDLGLLGRHGRQLALALGGLRLLLRPRLGQLLGHARRLRSCLGLDAAALLLLLALELAALGLLLLGEQRVLARLLLVTGGLGTDHGASASAGTSTSTGTRISTERGAGIDAGCGLAVDLLEALLHRALHGGLELGLRLGGVVQVDLDVRGLLLRLHVRPQQLLRLPPAQVGLLLGAPRLQPCLQVRSLAPLLRGLRRQRRSGL